MVINKRPFDIDTPEHTESNAREVTRKFEDGLTEEDLNTGLKGSEWKTGWLQSQSEFMRADVLGLTPSGDQPDRLLMHIPYDCKVLDMYIYSNTSGDATGEGAAHDGSNFQLFQMISKNRSDQILTNTGYSTALNAGLQPYIRQQVIGPYDFDLKAGDVLALKYTVTGDPYPSSSGTWQVMAKVERL